jgi:hypothetical protein
LALCRLVARSEPGREGSVISATFASRLLTSKKALEH